LPTHNRLSQNAFHALTSAFACVPVTSAFACVHQLLRLHLSATAHLAAGTALSVLVDILCNLVG